MADELRLTIRNELSELARVASEAAAFLARVAAPAETDYAVQLALEEVVSNVVRHGYDDEDAHEIEVVLRRRSDGIEVVVRDDGRAFDPTAAPAARVDAPLEERLPGGLGIHLVRGFAKELVYRRDGRLNELRVVI